MPRVVSIKGEFKLSNEHPDLLIWVFPIPSPGERYLAFWDVERSLSCKRNRSYLGHLLKSHFLKLPPWLYKISYFTWLAKNVIESNHKLIKLNIIITKVNLCRACIFRFSSLIDLHHMLLFHWTFDCSTFLYQIRFFLCSFSICNPFLSLQLESRRPPFCFPR